MGFHWQTENDRRKEVRDEEFARRAIANLHRTMAHILREQLNRDRLRPGKRRLIIKEAA